MNDIVSFNRIWLLVRSTVIGNYRNWFTTTLTLAAVVFFASLLSSGDGGDFYQFWFAALLIFLGIVFTSRAFREVHDRTRSHAYLLTPASSLEKTAARLFITTLGFFGFLVVFMTLISMLIEFVGFVAFGDSFEMFNPLAANVWKVLPLYLFLQSFYFLGAAWFRKLHFIKTTLALSVVFIALGIFTAVSINIFYLPYLDNLEVFIEPVFKPLFENNQRLLGLGVMSLVILVVLACWTIAWQRLEEVQVSDGI